MNPTNPIFACISIRCCKSMALGDVFVSGPGPYNKKELSVLSWVRIIPQWFAVLALLGAVEICCILYRISFLCDTHFHESLTSLFIPPQEA